jgi:acetylornithine deacetylase/succinyl-diaminopimelate desuccinylase-like protein
MGSSGIKKLLKRFDIKPDFVVYGGPTNLEINTAHPGQAIFEIITKGKMSNIGNVKEGENAILKMNEVLACLKENVTLPEDKRFGKANMIFSSITSLPVNEFYAIPSLCKALVVRQYFKGENPDSIRDGLLETLKKNGYKDSDVDIQLKTHHAPMEIDPNVEVVKVLKETKDFVMKKEAKISQWTSGISMSNLFDIDVPIVGFGPGDEKFAHTSIEHIPIDHIKAAVKLYTVLGEKICVQMKEKTEA